MGSKHSNFYQKLARIYEWTFVCESLAFSSSKLVSAIFYQIFIFSADDSPSKTIKNAYFIEKALFVLENIEIFVIFTLPFHTFHTIYDVMNWLA